MTSIGNTLYAGNTIQSNLPQALYSNNNLYHAVLNTDSQLCIYTQYDNPAVGSTPLYCTNSNPLFGTYPPYIMSIDTTVNQLQVVDSSTYRTVMWYVYNYWTTNPLQSLVMDNDGQLKLYDSTGTIVWTSDNTATVTPVSLGSIMYAYTTLNSTNNDVLISNDGQYTASFDTYQLCIYNSNDHNLVYWCSTGAYTGIASYALVITETELQVIDTDRKLYWSVSEAYGWPYPLHYIELDIDSRLKLYDIMYNLIWTSSNVAIIPTAAPTSGNTITSGYNNNINTASSNAATAGKTIGIIFSALIGAGLVLGIVLCYWWRKRRQRYNTEQLRQAQVAAASKQSVRPIIYTQSPSRSPMPVYSDTPVVMQPMIVSPSSASQIQYCNQYSQPQPVLHAPYDDIPPPSYDTAVMQTEVQPFVKSPYNSSPSAPDNEQQFSYHDRSLG